MRLFLQRLGSAFAYTTVRQVKVHSVTVGLLYLTLVVAISAYVVGYEFFLGESKVAAAEAEEGAGRLTRGLGAQWPRRARQKRTAKSKRGGKEARKKKKFPRLAARSRAAPGPPRRPLPLSQWACVGVQHGT